MGSSEREERAIFIKKWAGFVSALWLMIFSGNYAYANYSEALKEVLDINQKHLNGLSIARDIGDSCGGIIAGIISNYLPPWALLCISAASGFLGYGVQWLVVSQTISPLPYSVMAIAATGGGVCISWMNTVVFTASVRNFSRNRGPVAGLFKACMGLSGAVFSVICNTLFSNSPAVYLLMLVMVPNMFCLISAIFFRPVPTAETQEEEQFERRSLFLYNVIATMLAIYIACLDSVTSNVEKTMAYQAVTVLILATIIVAPAVVPAVVLFINREKTVRDAGDDVIETISKENENRITYDGKSAQNHQTSTVAIKITDDPNGTALLKPLLESDQKSLRQRLGCQWCCSLPSSSAWTVEGLGKETPTLSLFKTWHYYILYFSLFCGCGSGIAFSNNLGQVGDSLGFESVNLFVSLFSLGNFFGRIISGNVSEYYIRVAGIPRPAWMGLAKVPMVLLFVWLSTGSNPSLYAGSLFLGFSHGCLVTLTIPIVSELYGLKHFSTNFVLTITYLVAGSYVFSSLAGYLYDRQAALQGDSSCSGPKCFGGTFKILAVFLTVALAFDALLTIISKSLYQNLRVVHRINS